MKSDSAVKPPNPFNPGSTVDATDFVGRVQELDNFKQKLRQTISGSLASMAVVGGYGTGKTSFLHKCKAIAEEQNALAIYFSLNEIPAQTRETLGNMLVQRIQEKVREEVILQRLSHDIAKVLQRIRVKTGSGIKVGLSAGQTRDFPNLQMALSTAWKALYGSRTAIVFLIDEARLLEKNKAELMLYLRAVLEHLQLEKTPVMFVPAGNLSITGPSGTGFSPLVRTFAPSALVNFTKEESELFVEKKLRQVKMRISKGAFSKAYATTEGHPFVLVAYLSAAYSKLQAGETELDEIHFKAADVEFVSIILSPFFARFYDQAGKASKDILAAMAEKESGEISLMELTDALGKENNELSPHLAKLVQDGSILRIDRGRYKLFHHLLGQYVRQSNSAQNKG
ncbi:ATP-binding protein [Candidatus Micrarchaeota archaeon]|nr:ATP-binding protein [Candidatus Micrarchaeota archaeon]